MQYISGTVDATNGSNIVTGTNTSWALVSITPGVDRFKIAQENITYDIVSVQSDTQLTLSVPYAGLTQVGVNYQIFRDFTAQRGYGMINRGDRDWPDWFQTTLNKIDSDIGSVLGTGGPFLATGINTTTPVTVFSENARLPLGGLFFIVATEAIAIPTIKFVSLTFGGPFGSPAFLAQYNILGIAPTLTWSNSPGDGFQWTVSFGTFNTSATKLFVT